MTTANYAAIAHLDWPVQPCESPQCVSGHPPATFVLRNHVPCQCQPIELICTKCAAWWLDFLKPYANRLSNWRCLLCGRIYRLQLPLYLRISSL